jgi:hypothetical protein
MWHPETTSEALYYGVGVLARTSAQGKNYPCNKP